MSKPISRRRILAGTSAGSLVTLVGCTRWSTGSDGSDSTTADRSGPANESDRDEEDHAEILESWQELDLAGEIYGTETGNWRMLGHNTGNTFVNPEAQGPSDSPSVQWQYDKDSLGIMVGHRHHYPLIVDGTVYTTVQVSDNAETESDEVEPSEWKVVAIDPATGEAETLLTEETRTRIWRPTIVDETLYVAVEGRVRAYDLISGEMRWQSDQFLTKASAIRCIDDVLLVTDNVVMTFADTGEPVPQLYALDADSGEIRWEAYGSGSIGLEEPLIPIVADGIVLFPHAEQVWDLHSGDVVADLPREFRYPVLFEGELYGLSDGADGSVLVSYEWETMEQRWVYEPEERVSAGWPVVIDDVVVVNGQPEGMLGIDRKTGERLWRTHPWDDYLGSLTRVATTGVVYVVHEGGAVTALDPTDGSIKWQLRTDEMEWTAISGCALADDLLVSVGSGGTLFGIS